MSGSSKEVWAHCELCGRKWKIFDLPMDMREMAKASRKVKCECGNKNPAICKTEEQHS